MEEEPTCGRGLAEHSAIPAKLGELIAVLAANLEAHIPTIIAGDAAGRAERDAYTSLVTRFGEVARLLAAASTEMAGYAELPMAEHDETAFSDPAIASAFANLVRVEAELIALLDAAHAHDSQMLSSMSGTEES